MRMRSEGYSTWFVIMYMYTCICLSVTTFSAAMCNQTANKRYLRVQCHTGFIYFTGIKRAAAFETYGVKQNEGANMQISTGLHVHCTLTSSAYIGGTRSCNAGRVLTLHATCI